MAIEVRDDSKELANQPIAVLRSIAAKEGVGITREMTASMIVKLIEDGRNGPIAKAMEASGDRPDPGWARIEIMKDPDPKAGNSDVFASVNGYSVLIQRGKKLDVPIKILRGSLMTAKTQVMREDSNRRHGDEGRYYFEEVYSYPFTVFDINEGPDPRPGSEVASARKNAPRFRFHKLFGYWPRANELRDWLRSGENAKGE